MTYLRGFDKGLDSEQMLVIDFGWEGRIQNNLDFIKSELGKNSAVQSVSASRATPGEFFPNAGTGIETPSGEMIRKGPALYAIDYDFISTYNIEVVAGRGYEQIVSKAP